MWLHVCCSATAHRCCRAGASRSAALQGGAGIKGMGVSLVDALSTLKIMGLEREFKE